MEMPSILNELEFTALGEAYFKRNTQKLELVYRRTIRHWRCDSKPFAMVGRGSEERELEMWGSGTSLPSQLEGREGRGGVLSFYVALGLKQAHRMEAVRSCKHYSPAWVVTGRKRRQKRAVEDM